MLAYKSSHFMRTASQSKARSFVVPAALSEKLPVDASTIVGEKVGKWLGTTYDLLAFPARAGAGALVSLPDKVQTMQNDVQRLVELAQDPRPLEEKQQVLAQEIETNLLDFLEKGVVVEQDILANLKTVLPAEAANLITELIPEPPNKTSDSYQDGPVVAAETSEYTEAPDAPLVTYGQQDVMAAQIASEISEIRNAVTGLKTALESMRNNTDVAQAGMLKITLKEARDQLTRRLAEVSPVTAPDPSVSAATREARILLDEVNAMFFAS